MLRRSFLSMLAMAPLLRLSTVSATTAPLPTPRVPLLPIIVTSMRSMMGKELFLLDFEGCPAIWMNGQDGCHRIEGWTQFDQDHALLTLFKGEKPSTEDSDFAADVIDSGGQPMRFRGFQSTDTSTNHIILRRLQDIFAARLS